MGDPAEFLLFRISEVYTKMITLSSNFVVCVGVPEEYTKITTPRQDVLFKKGYLGRKRPTAPSTADSTASVNSSSINPDTTAADIANGNYSVNGTAEQSEGKVKLSTLEKTKIISRLSRESNSDILIDQLLY
jgi:hypothetical protein